MTFSADSTHSKALTILGSAEKLLQVHFDLREVAYL